MVTVTFSRSGLKTLSGIASYRQGVIVENPFLFGSDLSPSDNGLDTHGCRVYDTGWDSCLLSVGCNIIM